MKRLILIASTALLILTGCSGGDEASGDENITYGWVERVDMDDAVCFVAHDSTGGVKSIDCVGKGDLE